MQAVKEQTKTLILSKKLSYGDIAKLYQIRAFLIEHFLQKHSLKSISKAFILNEFKLKYGFKNLFGTPVIRYVDDLKMAHGKQLLTNTELSVLEIADLLGYNHYNNFSNAFRFGQSPLHLRQNQDS